MKLYTSYVLRYAVLKPMGVVFLGHKLVYENKNILQSIPSIFPSISISFLNVLAFERWHEFYKQFDTQYKWQIKCIQSIAQKIGKDTSIIY